MTAPQTTPRPLRNTAAPPAEVAPPAAPPAEVAPPAAPPAEVAPPAAPPAEIAPPAAPPAEGALPAAPPADDTTSFDRPLFNVFAEIATRQPDHVAVDDGTARLTYAELRDRALALGARVAALVPVDGLVGILVPTNVLYPVAWLACLAARRAFLPPDPHLPPARNQAIVAEAGLSAVILPTAAAGLATWLPAVLPRIPMTPGPGPDPPPPSPTLAPAKVGVVLFTSGSTGRPKGIALHERSALRNVILKYRAACAIGPADRLLSLHPPSTFGGAGDTFGTLLCGARLHLVDLKRDGLAPALALLRGGGITVCATVPVVVRALMAIEGAADAFRTLRIMRLGGDAVMGSDIAALARLLAPTARIMVGFGMTETGGVVAQRLIDPRAPIEAGRIAVGTPMPDQFVSVLDASGEPARPNEAGQLLVRGRYVALGHWVGGRIDPAAFPPDPSDPAISDPATSGRRCYRSGDMVLLRPDGTLVPVGRTDRQVKINGIRVEPVDTEAALRSLPDVADAAVLVQGDADTPTLVAFVVPAPGENHSPQQHLEQQNSRDITPADQNARQAPDTPTREREWRSALTALLPPQQVPARIHLVPAIPLLPSLKPDLSALRALASARDAPGMLPRLRARLRRHAAQLATAPALPPPRYDGTA